MTSGGLPVFAPPHIGAEARDDGTVVLQGDDLAPYAPSMAHLFRAGAAAHPERVLATQPSGRRAVLADLGRGAGAGRRDRPVPARSRARTRPAARRPVGQLARAPGAHARRVHRRRADRVAEHGLLAPEPRSRAGARDRGPVHARARVRRRRRRVRARARGRPARRPCAGRGHRRSGADRADPRGRRGPRRAGPGHRRQDRVHLGLDRPAEGRADDAPHAVLQPAGAGAGLALRAGGAPGARGLAPVEPHVRRQPQPGPGHRLRRDAAHRRRQARPAAVRPHRRRAARAPADRLLQRPGGVRAPRPAPGIGPRVRGALPLPPALHVLRGRRAARGAVGPAAGARRRRRRPRHPPDRLVGHDRDGPRRDDRALRHGALRVHRRPAARRHAQARAAPATSTRSGCEARTSRPATTATRRRPRPPSTTRATCARATPRGSSTRATLRRA